MSRARVSKLLYEICEKARFISMHVSYCVHTTHIAPHTLHTNSECVAGVWCYHLYAPYAAHTSWLLTKHYYMNIYVHIVTKAIKLRLWNFYLIWAGLSPYVCTCHFFQIHSWRHHFVPSFGTHCVHSEWFLFAEFIIVSLFIFFLLRIFL